MTIESLHAARHEQDRKDFRLATQMANSGRRFRRDFVRYVKEVGWAFLMIAFGMILGLMIPIAGR